MSSRVEKALENHGKGYNCCQAVACAYADLVGVDENLIFAAGEGFGAGMGGMQCTCGAVSGACMVTGLLKSSRNTKEPVTKGATYPVPVSPVLKACWISCQQRDRSEIWREERFRGLQGSERDRDRQGSAVL